MLSRKVSHQQNQELGIPNQFLDTLPTNKQIKNFVISHISPLKSRLKTQSVNDLSLNNDLSIGDLQQIFLAEKQKNQQQIDNNKIRYNNQVDMLYNLKHLRKVSQNQIALPKIDERKNSRILYMEAYSEENKMNKNKEKQKRSVSLSSKQREKSLPNENQIDQSKKQSSIKIEFKTIDKDNCNLQSQQKSTKTINLKTLSPSISKRAISQYELEEQIKKQVKFVKRKLELDNQVSEQVGMLQKKIEQEKDLEKMLLETYEKENKDNEQRKQKIQQQNKQAKQLIKQQLQEKTLKNKEQFEKQKQENSKLSQAKQEEDKKNNLILIQKKKELQNHYKELAKQILTKQKANQQTEFIQNRQKEQSFNDKICNQDETRINSRQENYKSIQGFLKKQQRDQKEHAFLEYKNMYDL